MRVVEGRDKKPNWHRSNEDGWVTYRQGNATVVAPSESDGRFVISLEGGHLEGHWKADSLDEAKQMAGLLVEFDAPCEWLAHRIRLFPESHFEILFANGGLNPGWVEPDGSVVVQQAPDYSDFDPASEASWYCAYVDDQSVLDTYPNVEAFVTEVFGREYYLAATDARVAAALEELLLSLQETDIRHLLRAGVEQANLSA